VLTRPLTYASYAVPVRQCNLLQSGLLQCMNYSIPPCRLLKLRSVTSVFKRLSLSGTFNLKNYIYHSGHTHSAFMQLGRTLTHPSALGNLSASVPADIFQLRFCIWLVLYIFIEHLLPGLRITMPQQRKAVNRCASFPIFRNENNFQC
jgi:hypothetical protein